MARHADRQIEHVLRRAGFGASADELDFYREMSTREAVETLVEYDSIGCGSSVQ